MNLKRTLKDRVTRTLILSMAFFFSGLAFFAFRMFDDTRSEVSEQTFSPDMNPSIDERVQLVPALASYPKPEVFHQFIYSRGAELVVEGACKDAYYTVMIFEQGVDYRATPLDARFNTAYPCIKNSFSERIPINTLFLKEGQGYYVLKAHQGETGTWYDPY